MKITFLGQNGLLIESKKSTIIVDPYLSDSVEKIEPSNKRRQPIDERFLSIKPNVVVITHAHADHYDEETLDKLLVGEETGEKTGKETDEGCGDGEGCGCTFFSPPSVFFKAKARYPKCNHVIFRSGTSVTVGEITFRTVRAEHSDAEAIGVIITAEGKNLYVTGDTLFSENVFKSLPKIRFNAVFLPVNGRGNNMNATDAGCFAARIKPDFVVPVHFGMFDDLSGADVSKEINAQFKSGKISGKIIIPEIYKEIEIK